MTAALGEACPSCGLVQRKATHDSADDCIGALRAAYEQRGAFLSFVRDREAKAQVAREDAENETKRVYGIAKMRERRIGNLLGHLEFIAGGGCESERAGLPRCVVSDDEDAAAPCNPCIARIAMAQRVEGNA